MTSRNNTRALLLDHIELEQLDTKMLSDRDILELIFHMLLEQRRLPTLNTAEPY